MWRRYAPLDEAQPPEPGGRRGGGAARRSMRLSPPNQGDAGETAAPGSGSPDSDEDGGPSCASPRAPSLLPLLVRPDQLRAADDVALHRLEERRLGGLVEIRKHGVQRVEL